MAATNFGESCGGGWVGGFAPRCSLHDVRRLRRGVVLAPVRGEDVPHIERCEFRDLATLAGSAGGGGALLARLFLGRLQRFLDGVEPVLLSIEYGMYPRKKKRIRHQGGPALGSIIFANRK